VQAVLDGPVDTHGAGDALGAEGAIGSSRGPNGGLRITKKSYPEFLDRESPGGTITDW
jgi:hypothetical protein